MKQLNRIFTITIALLACLLFGSCGKNKLKEETITGLVLEVSMNRIVLDNDHGNPYEFSWKQAKISGEDGILVGDFVRLTYTGELGENPIALKIVVEDKAVEGIVTEVTGTTLTLETDNGDMYTFEKEGAKVNSMGGISVGNFVSIIFTGDLNKKPTALKIDVDTGMVKTLLGTVTDGTMESITVETAEGYIYIFARENAEVEGSNGIVIGEIVAITYSGNLNENPTALKIIVESNLVTGVVTVLTGEQLTVESQAGPIYTFLLKDSQVESVNGIHVGSLVTIAYSGNIYEEPVATNIVVVGNSVSGKIVEQSGTHFYLETADSKRFGFLMEDDLKEKVILNISVLVVYEGEAELSDGQSDLVALQIIEDGPKG